MAKPPTIGAEVAFFQLWGHPIYGPNSGVSGPYPQLRLTSFLVGSAAAMASKNEEMTIEHLSASVTEEKAINLHTKPLDDADLDDLESASDFLDAVRVATEREHELTFRQALRMYPGAFLWAIIISFTIVMEGYNTYLLGNFYAYPAFAKKYGTYQPATNSYLVEPKWQVTLSDVSIVGTTIGLVGMGPACDRFGHRKVIMAGLVSLVAITFMLFFSPNIQVLTASLAIGGIPYGFFGILGSAYASEVAPLALRGFLTSFVNICWVIGQCSLAGSKYTADHTMNDRSTDRLWCACCTCEQSHRMVLSYSFRTSVHVVPTTIYSRLPRS